MSKLRQVNVTDDGDVEVILSRAESHVWIDVDRYVSVRIERLRGGTFKLDVFRSGEEMDDSLLSTVVNAGNRRARG